jgi:hypothetical protein
MRSKIGHRRWPLGRRLASPQFRSAISGVGANASEKLESHENGLVLSLGGSMLASMHRLSRSTVADSMTCGSRVG